jgi:hypothetical protein
VVIQIAIGHFITDFKQDWLIAIHVPLAFVIFGGAILLPFQAIGMRRAATPTGGCRTEVTPREPWRVVARQSTRARE